MNFFLKHKLNSDRYLVKRMNALEQSVRFYAFEWYYSFRHGGFPEYMEACEREVERNLRKLEWYSDKFTRKQAATFLRRINSKQPLKIVNLGDTQIEFHR